MLCMPLLEDLLSRHENPAFTACPTSRPLRDGIPVEESTWKQLEQSVSRFHVALPAF
jgi:hypothetical protein